MYGENSLSYPVLGTEETVRSFNSQKLKKYIKQKYTPNNSVISVCGKFDEKELQELIEKYFGNWVVKDEYVPEYKEFTLSEGKLYKDKKIEQIHVSLGIKALGSGEDNEYAQIMLTNI